MALEGQYASIHVIMTNMNCCYHNLNGHGHSIRAKLNAMKRSGAKGTAKRSKGKKPNVSHLQKIAQNLKNEMSLLVRMPRGERRPMRPRPAMLPVEEQ